MPSRLIIGFAAVLGLLLSACGRPGDEAADTIEADLVFVDVNVIPMTAEQILEGHTVIVNDGRIAAIEPADESIFGDSTIVVDGAGKYLIPGLADMHVHANGPSYLDLFVGHGITLIRNMWGFPEQLAWREAIAAGRMLGPRIVTAGAIVDGEPTIWDGSVGVSDAAAAIAEMDAQKAAGYDFLKIYEQLPAEAFEAIAAHSTEIDFPFAGHVPQGIAVERAMQSGMRTIEHLIGWDEATALPDSDFAAAMTTADRMQQSALTVPIAMQLTSGELDWADVIDPERRRATARLAAETGVWHVPTLVVLDRVRTSRRDSEIRLAEEAMRYMSPATLAAWNPSNDFRQEFSDEQLEALQIFQQEHLARVKALHDAGAKLLAGSDTPNPWVVPGIGLHQELEWLVRAGLTPYDALVTATRAPAEFLGDDSFGTIEIGKRADLVLLDANPLDNISATQEIAGVSIQYTWLPRQNLDDLLDSVAQRAGTSAGPQD